MKDLAEVCPLSRRMMLRGSGVSPRTIRIPAITVGPSLSPHSFTRTPVGSPCGVPTDWFGGVRAYPVSRMSHERGRPPLSAGSTMVHGRATDMPCSRAAFPFGTSLSAPLARSRSRRLSEVHLRWPYRSSLAPRRVALAATASPHGSASRCRWVHCPRSFACRLTPAGRCQPLRPGREQLVEQLVSSSHKHLLVRQRTRATFRSHVGSRGEGRRERGVPRP